MKQDDWLPRLRALEAALLAAGLAFLAFLAWRFDWRSAWGGVERVGWGLAIFLLLEIMSKALNAWGLWLLVPGRKEAFARLFSVILAADSVNYLVPTGAIGGHALAARALGRALTTRESVAVVTASGTLQVAAQFTFAIAGVAVMLALPERSPVSGWVGGGMIGVSVCALALTLGVLSKGVYERVWGVIRRVWKGAPDASHYGLGGIDVELIRLFHERRADAAAAFFVYLAGWLWGVSEVWVVLTLLGIPFNLGQAFAVEAISVFVDGVLFFVPAKAGTQEGGKVLAFSLVGLPAPAGLAFGLLRRVRELVWTGIGYGTLMAGWRGVR
jgi:uncharacterized membrane protein YbhN (UPF0104 family)